MTGTYDLILQLPLFQGLSREDLTKTIEKFSFSFEKFQAGQQILKRGDVCSRMVFILSGKVRSHLKNDRETIQISETMSAPNMIAINHLYGNSQYYSADYFAFTEVGIMTIDKLDLFKMIQTNEIFYYNILNSLSVRAQNGVRTLLNMSMNSPESRFAMWIVPLTGYNTEDLQLSCRKTNLASILGISRPTLDTLLQDLQKKEMIRAEKGVIHILDREKFAEYIK